MLKRVLPRVADYAVVDTALQNLNGSFPEALKKSILQEAVQSKLVPQDPSDEPAEALLERIRAEKQRLISDAFIIDRLIVTPVVAMPIILLLILYVCFKPAKRKLPINDEGELI